MGKKKSSKGLQIKPKRSRPKQRPAEVDDGRYGKKKRPKRPTNEFQEPDDDSVFHEASCEVQDFSQFGVEEPKIDPAPQTQPDTEEIMRKMEQRIAPRIEEALQNYMDKYLYAELERRFKELAESMTKTDNQTDWSALEDIKVRLDGIEATQQKLLQHQMELELEMVCSTCGRTIPDGARECPHCSRGSPGREPDFYEDDNDYQSRRNPEPQEEFDNDDDDDFIVSERPKRGQSVEDMKREFERMGSFERIPVQEYYGNQGRDRMEWDGGRTQGGQSQRDYDRREGYDRRGGYDDYDPSPGSKQTFEGASRSYNPSPASNTVQESDNEPAGPPPGCPSCYRPLEYVNQYDAYYCRNCNGYLDMSTRKLVKVGPSGEKKKSASKRYSDSSQKMEDVVSYIEYDPDKEPQGPARGGKRPPEKKKKGLFGFGSKK